MEPGAGRELAPHYYRDNFLALCATVETQYGDLLAPGERSLLQRFRDLPFDAHCLYVRRVSRGGPWFRESRLAYPERGAIAPLVDSLLATGLSEHARNLPVAYLPPLETRFAGITGRMADSVRGKFTTAFHDAEGMLDAFSERWR